MRRRLGRAGFDRGDQLFPAPGFVYDPLRPRFSLDSLYGSKVGLPREEDRADRGVPFFYNYEEFIAFHAWHKPIREDEDNADTIRYESIDDRQGIFRAGSCFIDESLLEMVFKFLPYRKENDRLIVDAEYGFPSHDTPLFIISYVMVIG